jgi:hypothetical protein
MNILRLALLAALLSSASAYAETAPNWTAAIGTGHATESTSNRSAPAAVTNPAGRASSPYWSAFIGTGRVTEAGHVFFAKAATAGSPTAALHWTSRIGTGHASESNADNKSSAVRAVRAQP